LNIYIVPENFLNIVILKKSVHLKKIEKFDNNPMCMSDKK